MALARKREGHLRARGSSILPKSDARGTDPAHFDTPRPNRVYVGIDRGCARHDSCVFGT